MSVRIVNAAGERIITFASDAEACRWYLESGRAGDAIEETGEDLATVTHDVLGLDVRYTTTGCVIPPHGWEASYDEIERD